MFVSSVVVMASCGYGRSDRTVVGSRDPGPEVRHALMLNRPLPFDLAADLVTEAGFVTGVDGPHPEISTTPTVAGVELVNPGPEDVVISAIHLNGRSMLLTDDAFDAAYQFDPGAQLETMERLFWDAYGTYSHGPSVATDDSLQRLLRGTGVGRCTETNGAMVAALHRQAVPARSAWAVGHALYDVLLDGQWRAFDLNMRRYTRDHTGEVIGARELWHTPQLSLLQASQGSMDLLSDRFRYAVITHTVQPDTRDITYDVSPDRVPLGLEAGDSIVFDFHPVRSRHIDNSEAVARGSMTWVRHGWLHLRPRPEFVDHALTIARQLPFPIDQVVLEATVSGAHAALIVNGATDAGPMEIAYVGAGEPRRVRVERDLDLTDRLQLTMHRTAFSERQVCRVEDLRVSIRFMFNARLLMDWRGNNLLQIEGHGGTVDAQIRFEPNARNPWRDGEASAVVARHEADIEITVKSTRPATHYEYFLATEGREHPVSPAFYWVDETGRRTVTTDTLPPGRYALHSRCRTEGGFWSRWHRTPARSLVDVPPIPIVDLAFRPRDGRVAVAALDRRGRPLDRFLGLRIGRNRFLSPRDDIGFLTMDPSGLVAEVVSDPPFPFDVVSIPPGGEVTLPPWAAFAIVRVDGRLASELIDVRGALRERGIDPDLVQRGTTFGLEHEVVDWPLEFYRIVEARRVD